MKTTKTPCDICPFRRTSLPGWLGDYTPELVIDTVRRGDLFCCHGKIDYEDEDWKKKLARDEDNIPVCAGSLIAMNQMCVLSRNPEIMNLQRQVAKKFDILEPRVEFPKHHHSLPGKKQKGY